jgi:molybdate transport system regulatory protein
LASPPEKHHRVKPAFKLWLEAEGKYVFGEGICNLLEKVEEEGSLSNAVRVINMSYRYAWGLIKEVEKNLGEAIVRTERGGEHGGKTELTDTGRWLVANYRRLRKTMVDACNL